MPRSLTHSLPLSLDIGLVRLVRRVTDFCAASMVQDDDVRSMYAANHAVRDSASHWLM